MSSLMGPQAQAYIYLIKIVDVVALVLALIEQCSRIWYFANIDVVARNV